MEQAAPYTFSAQVYDALTGRQGLRAYGPGYQKLLEIHRPTPGLVVDAACGTGLWSHRLAKGGHQVVAVDRSRAMLARARYRCRGLPVRTVIADLTKLPVLAKADLVTCTYDSLNYLTAVEEVARALVEFRRALEPKRGVAVFDVNTSAALRVADDQPSEVRRAGRAVAIWTRSWDPEARLAKLVMEIFVPVGKGGARYVRREEVHLQRAYEPATIIDLARAAGFASVEAYDLGSSMTAPHGSSKKVVYIASCREGNQ